MQKKPRAFDARRPDLGALVAEEDAAVVGVDGAGMNDDGERDDGERTTAG